MADMGALIHVINRLQDVVSRAGIANLEALNLPQIVVVGSQSAGKSSVLESFVGRDFLPRGQGLVTRLPLVLQLIRVDNSSGGDGTATEEYGIFLHNEGRTFKNFDDVRKEIETETERVMGINKGIGKKPIGLKVYSPSVVNLTLVDLPGLTKNPVGDQPADIEQQITELILSYIENPNSLILAVTPANVDMATSEALKLAKQVDPDGKRTLAVITKLDLMDPGTNAREVLSGNVIPVKLGIIGVVNRSQLDIDTKESIAGALEEEKKFLAKNYSELAHKHGTQHLGRTLNKLLLAHIRERLPDLKAQVNAMTQAHKKLLTELGRPVVDKESKESVMISLIVEFVKAYSSTLDGTNLETDGDSCRLKGGALISLDIFQNTFSSDLFDVEALGDLELKDIVHTLRTAAGLYPPLTVPDKAFQELAKRQIARMVPPCVQCVGLVYEEMQRVIQRCGKDIQLEFYKFPKLYEALVGIVSDFLKQKADSTTKRVRYLLEIQVTYINPKHPDFCDEMEALLEERSAARGEQKAQEVSLQHNGFAQPTASKVARSTGKSSPYLSGTGRAGMPGLGAHRPLAVREANFLAEIEEFDPSNIPPREMEDVELMKKLVTKYFTIVQKTIHEIVPKAIVHSLIEQTKNSLHNLLITKLYVPGATNEFAILQEAREVTEQRNNVMAMLEALDKASKIINEVRDMSYYGAH